MDAVPLISQTKSLIQWICQDSDGALVTQENFSKRCPIISQLRSAGEAMMGCPDNAKRTQLEFARELESLINGVPVVGHVKGTVHYICKDNEKGDESMKAASRTVGVLLGGIGGGVVGGPVGAVTGGIAGGVALDGITTTIESAVKREVCTNGVIRIAQEVRRNPKNPGLYVDTIGGLVMDGISGYASFRFTARVIAAAESSSLVSKLPRRLKAVTTAESTSQIVPPNSSNGFAKFARGTTRTLASLRVPAEMLARVVSTHTQTWWDETFNNGTRPDVRSSSLARNEALELEEIHDRENRPMVMVKPNPVIGLLEKEFGRVVPLMVDRFCEYYTVDDSGSPSASQASLDPHTSFRSIFTLPPVSSDGSWAPNGDNDDQAVSGVATVSISTQTEISPDDVLTPTSVDESFPVSHAGLQDEEDGLSSRLSDESWVLVDDVTTAGGIVGRGDQVEEIDECSQSSSILSYCSSLEDESSLESGDEGDPGFKFTSKPKLVLRLRN